VPAPKARAHGHAYADGVELELGQGLERPPGHVFD
jgi:hypothetical protein